MKVDTNKIAGYSEMTAEEKIKALEDFDMEIGADYISKKAFDKAASELADAKKRLKEKQTDEENAAAERDEMLKDIQGKYDALLKTSTIANYKAQYIANGFDDKLATETAEAMYSGDTNKVFANLAAFREEYGKKVKADALQGMKQPQGGNSDPKHDAYEDQAIAMGKAMAKSRASTQDVISKYF